MNILNQILHLPTTTLMDKYEAHILEKKSKATPEEKQKIEQNRDQYLQLNFMSEEAFNQSLKEAKDKDLEPIAESTIPITKEHIQFHQNLVTIFQCVEESKKLENAKSGKEKGVGAEDMVPILTELVRPEFDALPVDKREELFKKMEAYTLFYEQRNELDYLLSTLVEVIDILKNKEPKLIANGQDVVINEKDKELAELSKKLLFQNDLSKMFDDVASFSLKSKETKTFERLIKKAAKGNEKSFNKLLNDIIEPPLYKKILKIDVVDPKLITSLSRLKSHDFTMMHEVLSKKFKFAPKKQSILSRAKNKINSVFSNLTLFAKRPVKKPVNDASISLTKKTDDKSEANFR